ncbi:MAG: DUF642 domain-containing protein [Fimbriimonadaceae bacterium]|nr:DUF642 domain-containing protein [Chthonomonadaceae bacterium]MCO5296781.1 DUF642 domain-containing protein [Fimbriimonadaceae bacterium]
MRILKYSIGALIVATTLGLSGRATAANLVSNGDFELANLGAANSSGSGYWTFNAGNSGINNWTVGMTSVDIVRAPYPFYGTQALDLVGTPGPGSVEQTLATVAGGTYEVRFQLYWTGSAINRQINVSLGSQSLNGLELNPSDTWLSFNLTFINVEANALLRLSTNPNNGGNGNTFIDNITVEAPVPEPLTMVLAGGALAAAIRRRRR